MPEPSADAFWCTSCSALYEQFGSDPSGLSSGEAARRFVQFGRNSVADAPNRRVLWKIARKFAEPLVAILVVAAGISAVNGDFASFGIILVVIALSITLDVIQEHRAELAVESLKRSVAIRADAYRDGKIVSIPVDQVVPGDVVELRAGDLVLAECRRSRDDGNPGAAEGAPSGYRNGDSIQEICMNAKGVEGLDHTVQLMHIWINGLD